MYLKRNRAEKTWPIPRKGSIYLVVPSHEKKQGIPLLVVIRDMLEIAKNKKETKKILNLKLIKINNKIVNDERHPLLLFDKLEIGDQIYKIKINENKKFEAEEVKSLDTKPVKIIGKKVLAKNKIQLNLRDGRNFIVKEKFKVGDSVLLNLKENKIEKNIAFKQGAEIFVIGGKHTGKQGKIENIKGEVVEVKTKQDKININIKNLMAI